MLTTRKYAKRPADTPRVLMASTPRRRRPRYISPGAGCGTMAAMRVYLGSDHGGYELKQAIVNHLTGGRARASRLRRVCI